jgi:hypothetical protein
MKRYALFAMEDYEAHGGWDDLRAMDDEVAPLIANMEALSREYPARKYGHIVDMTTGKVILRASGFRRETTVLVGQPRYEVGTKWTEHE